MTRALSRRAERPLRTVHDDWMLRATMVDEPEGQSVHREHRAERAVAVLQEDGVALRRRGQRWRRHAWREGIRAGKDAQQVGLTLCARSQERVSASGHKRFLGGETRVRLPRRC